MYTVYPHWGDNMNIMHKINKEDIVEEMRRSMPRIYASLDNRQVDYQSHMIEVESKINSHPITSLIDFGASHSYVDPNMVDIFKLKRYKHEKFQLVHLATGTKRRINDLVKYYAMNMNGVGTKKDLKIILIGSYDCLIGMDWI